ncbi:hypothetical protein ABT364_23990 [Massilia sp. SR12]
MVYLLTALLAGVAVLLLCLIGRLGRKTQALLAATLPWLINVAPALATGSGHLPRAILFAAIASPVVFALIWYLPIVRVDEPAEKAEPQA